MTQIARLIVGFVGLGFVGLCAYAYNSIGWQGFDRVLAEPWGLVTLSDVLVGAVCMNVIIFFSEDDWRVALAWGAPIFVLGHVISCVWIVSRYLRAK